MLASCFSHFAVIFFFFNDTATTEIYTLSLHDALPISTASTSRRWCSPSRPTCWVTAASAGPWPSPHPGRRTPSVSPANAPSSDRKSTRLNSSHANISYAVFCLKKKKTNKQQRNTHYEL